jgi:hypothetical protein
MEKTMGQRFFTVLHDACVARSDNGHPVSTPKVASAFQPEFRQNSKFKQRSMEVCDRLEVTGTS